MVHGIVDWWTCTLSIGQYDHMIAEDTPTKWQLIFTSEVSLQEQCMMSQQWNGYDLPLDLSVKVNYVQELDHGCKRNSPVHDRKSEWEDNLQALDLRTHRNKKTTTMHSDTTLTYSDTTLSYGNTTLTYSDTTPTCSDTTPSYNTYWQLEDLRYFSFDDYNVSMSKEDNTNILLDSIPTPDVATPLLSSNKQNKWRTE
ncbi:hypothetical protein EB796_006473 [Bugula neritina]|uniref:Uncharacterized protein n=1 Tax=Bugula neritina TaxID=10212 RepID=A0A7J7KC97_BUGNE|nr:hypothetical protein EB796_006473 [Bugula neritina]